MSRRYKAYREYKHSGVEWLGDVPVQWDAKRLKNGARLLVAKDCIEGQQVIALENIEGWTGKHVETVPEYKGDGILCAKNDLLFGKLRPYLAKVYQCTDVAIAFGDLLAYRPDSTTDSRFLFYAMLTDWFISIVDGSTYGAKMPRASSEFVGNMWLAFPPHSEQRAIASFLDRETGKIDQLIAKQERMIELLKEKRQAVISHAVTKGLDPHVPMKDSGIEWLGGIPEHWKVKDSKHCLLFITSGSRGWAQFYADDGDVFFRIGNLQRNAIDPDMSNIQFVAPPDGAEGERSRVKKYDLLISITADLGSVAVANESIVGAYVSQHVALARPNSKHIKSPRWFAYALVSDAVKNQFQSSGYGGTKIQLSLEDVKTLNIAFPPRDEQKSIADYLDEATAKIDRLIAKAEQSIDLMKERQTALISAAVTGKIDVKEK